MSAQDRSRVHSEVAHRARVLQDVQRIGVHRWLKYAGMHDLPSDPGRCSTKVLEAARDELLPKPTQPEGKMALKGAAKKSAVVGAIAASKIFLVTFPTTKPQQAKASVLVGDEPKAEEGMTQVSVASPKDLDGMPQKALLALANIGNTGTPIRKVTSDDAARQMAWDALTEKVEVTSDAPEKAPKTRAVKLVSFPAKAKDEIKQVRKGTKVATAIDLLGREGGVLLSEFEAALSQTGKSISGRAWLGYDVAKVVGYGVASEAEGDNDLRLSLVLPKGMKAPLEHKKPEPKPVKAEKPAVEGPKSKAKKAAEPEPAPEVVAEPAPVAKKAAAKKSAKK